MKTKIGNIESYKDFFEVIETDKEGEGDFGAIIMDTLKCKLCGDVFRDFNRVSAQDGRYSGQYEKHIKLHESIKNLMI